MPGGHRDVLGGRREAPRRIDTHDVARQPEQALAHHLPALQRGLDDEEVATYKRRAEVPQGEAVFENELA